MRHQKQKNQNVMELLVDEEIQYQLNSRKISAELKVYLNLLEIATFALNRLPPLYASSIEGIEMQKRKAKEKYRQKIEAAVSFGFSAIERDPLKKSHPIESEENDIIKDAKKILPELENVISQEELVWIVSLMENFLQRIKSKKITEQEVTSLYRVFYHYWKENS